MSNSTSSAELKVREIKRDLILQVYLGHGLFWKGVKRDRAVQGVEVKVGLPPPRPYPPRLSLSYPKGHPTRPEGSLKELRAWVKRKRQAWDTAVRVAWELAVPTVYRNIANWDKFTAACILYDPPEPTPNNPNAAMGARKTRLLRTREREQYLKK